MNREVSLAFQAEVAELIGRVVRETTGRDVTLTPEHRLIRDGYLDSISIVNLVFLIHTTYGVEIDVTEIDETNFGSVLGVASLIVSRR